MRNCISASSKCIFSCAIFQAKQEKFVIYLVIHSGNRPKFVTRGFLGALITNMMSEKPYDVPGDQEVLVVRVLHEVFSKFAWKLNQNVFSGVFEVAEHAILTLKKFHNTPGGQGGLIV